MLSPRGRPKGRPLCHHVCMRKLLLFVPLLLIIPSFSSAATCPSLTRNLSVGSRGTDVTQLQTFLIEQGYLAAGNSTGYFGRMTEASVKAWQAKNGVVSSGTAATTGYGAIGPRSRVKLVEACRGVGSVSGDFSVLPTRGAAPLTVTALFSAIPCPYGFEIDWGDGTKFPDLKPGDPIPSMCGRTSERTELSHTYTRSGTYPIILKNPETRTAVITVTADGTSSSLSDQIQKISAEIKATIGTAASDVLQCRTMAFGHKACGGPGSYIVYSIQSTDESKLENLVKTLYDLSVQYQQQRQWSSTCDITPQPSVVLQNGACVAVSY